ncbi:MAG: cysteine hydrolase [Clostridia bacterium]|nr:cysteine hydrolase [Clostridia bacterium]
MSKALIVVDYQKDFVDGSLGFEGAEKLEKGILEKIEEYKRAGEDVIFTKDCHMEDYLESEEGKKLPVGHCIKGTEGFALYGNLNEEDGKVFEKETFGSLDLGLYLREKNYDEICLVGLVSNICVTANSVIAKAACPNAKIQVDARLVGSGDKEMEKKALDVLENLHIDIIY